jgi:Lar family restriction alleviation protein
MTSNTEKIDGLSPELLSCPFCARTDDLLVPQHGAADEWWHEVYCDNCCARGPTAPTEHEAIAAWNTRTAHDFAIGERGWQRIETAPKQSHPHILIAYTMGNGLRRTCEGFWDVNANHNWDTGKTMGAWWTFAGMLHGEATHWMPTPEPPTLANQGAHP